MNWFKRYVRIGGSRQPSKQERAQVAEDLAGAGRDVQSTGAFREVRQRFGRAFLVPKNVQTLGGRIPLLRWRRR